MLGEISGGECKCLKEVAICAITGRETEISYASLQNIGSGTFGVVTRISVNGSSEYALKRVFEKSAYMNRELEMLQTVSHRCIVRAFWYFYEKQCKDGVFLNIIMEYVKSDLFFHIVKKTHFPRSSFIDYAVMLLEGLEYLHSLGIAHRDIKPSNVLIDVDAKILKLCDLGSAKKIAGAENNVLYICSRYYRAPEIHEGAPYGLGIDIWAAGCVLFEMITHTTLFPGQTASACLERIHEVLNKSSLEAMAATARREELADCVKILKEMLAFDPEKRASAKSALRSFKILQSAESHANPK
ncbi:uncharacterized protein NEMAJ01_0173 [Nematocida major]|uniref:uncharacterized protein n=1 Tax=Nematocida major TaxID=1912982 RepID=UPI0020077E52|nr:uncharacterized protein NEMAJ01_0173 [Nematocida major]KAH9385277.1 hypothetical protein NEMAJ01_0173 [Nematocida major]